MSVPLDSANIREILEAAWPDEEGLFPAEIIEVVEADAISLADLHPEELRWSEQFGSEKRKREFLAGRALARRALSPKLLTADTPLLPGEDGAPLWPQGVVAAISHSAGKAFFAASKTAENRYLGIDLQELREIQQGLKKQIVCSPEEEIFADSDEKILTLFSAKEAAFKAIYRECDFQFMPRRMELTPLGDNRFRLTSFRGSAMTAPSIMIVSRTYQDLIFSLAGRA